MIGLIEMCESDDPFVIRRSCHERACGLFFLKFKITWISLISSRLYGVIEDIDGGNKAALDNGSMHWNRTSMRYYGRACRTSDAHNLLLDINTCMGLNPALGAHEPGIWGCGIFPRHRRIANYARGRSSIGRCCAETSCDRPSSDTTFLASRHWTYIHKKRAHLVAVR